MRILRIAGLFVFAMALSGLANAADEAKAPPKDIPDFDVHGISMTECQCTAYACPCRSNGHPDHGSCDAADFTYIKNGHYGKVDMSGFKAVLIGDLIDHDASKVQGTAYFDKSSTPAQREAFNEMLSFMFGWNPPHIVGSKVVAIDFKESPDKSTYALTIPDILEEKGVIGQCERVPHHERNVRQQKNADAARRYVGNVDRRAEENDSRHGNEAGVEPSLQISLPLDNRKMGAPSLSRFLRQGWGF